MYHSVTDRPERHVNTLGEIVHPTSVFRRQMEVVAREYNSISLDDVLPFLQGKKRLQAKPVVVTFDDGYAGNFEIAAPTLNELGIPAMFYLTVDCIDRGTPPWVSRLRLCFSTTRQVLWSDSAGDRWPLQSAPDRDRAFRSAAEHCARLTGDAQEAFLSTIEHNLGAEPLSATENLMMTWDQVRQLVRQGHTVGSHTMTHPNLAHVKQEEMEFEITQSKRRLEGELDRPIVHFSYPCPILQPHWSPQTVAVCRAVGYDTAVTTDAGPVREGDDPFFLHRVPPGPDVEGLRWNLECTFLGRAP